MIFQGINIESHLKASNIKLACILKVFRQDHSSIQKSMWRQHTITKVEFAFFRQTRKKEQKKMDGWTTERQQC